jgi:type VI secretion system secreted protein VgrG
LFTLPIYLKGRELFMKKTNKKKFVVFSLISLLIVMTLPVMGASVQEAVNLGTASSFTILAGSTITNTGTSQIGGTAGGNIGLHPGTIFTGQTSATISGSVNLADAVALQAKNDLQVAYNDAIGRTPVDRIGTELGGTIVKPGVYDSADGTFQLTGTLTLDGEGNPNAVFVFKTASTLITASGSNIVMINGATSCNTYWVVGSSATLGTNSSFIGQLMAQASITANTGATIQGKLLALTGAVTLDTNTITNDICAFAPAVTTETTTDTTTGVPPVTTAVIEDTSETIEEITMATSIAADLTAETTFVPDEAIPVLPQSGQSPSLVFYTIGSMIALSGYILLKVKK